MARRATRSVDHQYFLRASPKKVFRAITDPLWLTRWLCDRATLVPRKGGRYELGWNDGPLHSGPVLEFVPTKRLTLAWSWPGVPLSGTRFRLSLEGKGRGTLLRVEHTGFPREAAWEDLYVGAEWGWTYFAMNLKSVLEGGRDLRSSLDG